MLSYLLKRMFLNCLVTNALNKSRMYEKRLLLYITQVNTYYYSSNYGILPYLYKYTMC